MGEPHCLILSWWYLLAIHSSYYTECVSIGYHTLLFCGLGQYTIQHYSVGIYQWYLSVGTGSRQSISNCATEACSIYHPTSFCGYLSVRTGSRQSISNCATEAWSIYHPTSFYGYLSVVSISRYLSVGTGSGQSISNCATEAWSIYHPTLFCGYISVVSISRYW